MARFTIRGNVRVYSIVTVTVPAAITAAQVTAGTNVTGVAEAEAIAAMEGWETSPSTINVPDVLSLTTGNIPGENTFGAASITYYTDTATNAAWDLFVEGFLTNIVIFPRGIGTGNDYTLFSVQVTNRTRMLATGNEAERHKITFAIRGRTEGEQAA